MMSGPVVSVIIPSHDREAYVVEAVKSVCAQTLRSLEIIVVDDGSGDGTLAALARVGDPRLRVVGHAANRGVAAARNTGLAAARGRFIAWLDSDDIARPTRLEQQVRVLQMRPEVAMVGCCAGKIGPDGSRRRGLRTPPFTSGDIGAWMLFHSPFQQSAVTGRTEVLRRYPFREHLQVCEDLDVFLRMGRSEIMLNLPQVLVDRRVHDGQAVRSHQAAIRRIKVELLAEPLRQLGARVTSEALRRHVDLGKTDFGPEPPTREFLGWAEAWLQHLIAANAPTRYVDDDGLRMAAGVFWSVVCRSAAKRLGLPEAVRLFLASSLPRNLLASHARDWLREAVQLHVRG
jgi:glycosyltransferase involved in cell wall biosynthesis